MIAEESRVAVDGGSLRLLAFGDPHAPPVVLLHGFGQTADFLRPLVAELLARSDARVLAPDLRGHGASDDAPPGAVADRVLVEDAYAVHAVAGRPAVWFGSSLGARVAALACAGRPGLARRVVLGECLLGLDRLWSFLLAGVRHRLAQHPGVFASLDEARDFAVGELRLPPPALEAWLRYALRPRDGGFAWTLRRGIVDAAWPALDLPAQLRGLDGLDVRLVFGGARSALSPPQKAAVAALFPGATVEELPECGHDLALDAPASVAARLVID